MIGILNKQNINLSSLNPKPLSLFSHASHTNPVKPKTMIMDNQQSKLTSKIFENGIYIFILCGLLYVILFNQTTITSFIFPSQQSQTQSHNTLILKPTTYKDDLDAALARASGENKTVIIAIVNKAYVEGYKPMLDIYLDGLWLGEDTQGLKDHLLVGAMDQTSYRRCLFHGLHCYKLKTDGVDFVSEKLYMSEEFIKMMWRRTLFLGDVLKRGYNFIFTDTDVLWLRNPFPKLIVNGSIDLQISTDKFNGDHWSEQNLINTGFYMVRSNNKTIALFDSWYAQKNNSEGLKEQDVLLNLMHQGLFRNLGLKVMFLDTVFFSGFCEDSKDARLVSTVHANCCRSIVAKVADLSTVMADWRRFQSLSANDSSRFLWSPHDRCIDSWRQ